jgi:hypothetical protein
VICDIHFSLETAPAAAEENEKGYEESKENCTANSYANNGCW